MKRERSGTLAAIGRKGGRTLSKQQGHGAKNTQTKTSDKKGNSSGNNH
ncbi:hypothetical protein [Cohnella massiliensis]|nr:hypothetical protein [Cohnella massiliensis]